MKTPQFDIGDKTLLTLPQKHNKLQMTVYRTFDSYREGKRPKLQTDGERERITFSHQLTQKARRQEDRRCSQSHESPRRSD